MTVTDFDQPVVQYKDHPEQYLADRVEARNMARFSPTEIGNLMQKIATHLQQELQDQKTIDTLQTIWTMLERLPECYDQEDRLSR